MERSDFALNWRGKVVDGVVSQKRGRGKQGRLARSCDVGFV